MGSFFIIRCFLLFFFLFDGAFAATGKSWSRAEMVEMAGYGEQKLSSVIITGSLLCDTSHPQLRSIAIPGATVAIKCHTGNKRRSKWIKAVTDDVGEFEIDLPSQLHAIPDLENTCFVKPVNVPKRYRCYHTSTNIHKRIKLVSSTNGFRVYSSGKIRLQGHS
uniref:Pollen-specific protein-like n=1 Tax=Noccaea caerulescens TaxID=107243 RepID=A0A1J3J8F4_NOCCA